MAKALPAVWGIDIGQCALKALRLELIDGVVTATAFDYIEHAKILSQPDADPDQLTRTALEQFLSRNQVKGDLVAISVPGQTGLARFVKLPPVEPKKIPDIVRFEAKQQIPFPLEEVVWDYQTLGSGGPSAGFVENEIGLFAMKRDIINRYLQAFQELKIDVHFIQMAPLALCNFVSYDCLGKGAPEGPKEGAAGEQTGNDDSGQCVVALDVGVDNTNLVVTDGERIIWQRPIPIGGNHFTRALTKDLKLTFAKAEHLKRNATKAPDPKQIFASMKPVFSDFVGEVQRSLGFFTNSHRDAQVKRVLGLGNAFRLPGLQKFVSQSLGIELEKPMQYERLKGDEVLRAPIYAENVLSFAVAYGLALQGLQMARLKTNLLPQEIQTERLIRAKKPWLATAAACLFIGTALYTYFIGLEFKIAKAASDAAPEAEKVPTIVSGHKSSFDKEQSDISKAHEAAGSILRGSQERTNWLLINRYLNECIPQPDGSNLPRQKDMTSKYWNDLARRAFHNDRDYKETGKKDDDSSDPSNLVQIDIERILYRYCDVPMATEMFNKVKKSQDAFMEAVIADPEWEKAPDKEGWAVEIHGHTFHKDGVRFVADTLVANLRNGPVPKRKKKIWSPLNDPSGRYYQVPISHVAIWRFQEYNWNPSTQSSASKFGGMELNQLVTASAAPATPSSGGTGGPPPGDRLPSGPSTGGGAGATAPAAGAPPARSQPWSGLGSAVGGSSSTSSYAGAAEPRPPMHPMGADPMGAKDKEKSREKSLKRTDFVIIFYWVEPLPTEGGAAGAGAAKPAETPKKDAATDEEDDEAPEAQAAPAAPGPMGTPK